MFRTLAACRLREGRHSIHALLRGFGAANGADAHRNSGSQVFGSTNEARDPYALINLF